MPKKKFLLLAPKSFNLYELIVKNLEHIGYEVFHVEDSEYFFRYRLLWQRLYNLMRKILFNDRSYKLKLKQENDYQNQLRIIEREDFFDIALVIRADFFRTNLIELIRHKTSLMISFHFDGISRDPQVLDYVQFFDRFYVFDEEDVKKYPSYHFLYSPNFYLDYPGLVDEKGPDNPYNVYYVSTFHESRIKDLMTIHRYLSKHYKSVKFIVVCSEQTLPLAPEYMLQHMEVRYEQVSFAEQLHHIAYSDVIIDLVITDHKGYSFRIIEGIKFGKKVITTNPKVLEAEFYHPNNFFVLQHDNYDGLDDFLKTPYMPIDGHIKEKYSFSVWLDTKLNQTAEYGNTDIS